ncbi:MAG: cellulase family glycosylhydrolase [Bacteroidota bacterium]
MKLPLRVFCIIALFVTSPLFLLGNNHTLSLGSGLPQPSEAFSNEECKQNYLFVDGNKLYDTRGEPVRLTGVNWFGFETSNLAFHGLWSRDMYSMLQQIKDLGFNTIRVPWTNDMLKPGASFNGVSVNNFGQDAYTGSTLNSYLENVSSPIEILDLAVAWCEENNLRIILDCHSRKADGYLSEGYWYTNEVSEEKWIADWVFMAERYKDFAAVSVADLNNEPHANDITWGYGEASKDWAKAAERCSEAIWKVNPNIVVCVEGIAKDQRGENYWWGGNLHDVNNYQLNLSKPDKLIYSFHEYGPEVFNQPWFNEASFPGNLKPLWDDRWAFVHNKGIGHLLMGEFGIKEEQAFGGKSLKWIKELMDYVGSDYSWTFWCFNPNSGDTGGILKDDWAQVNTWKMNLLTPHLAPEIPSCISAGTTSILKEEIPNLKVYPNPAHQEVWFETLASSPTISHVKLYNLSGKTVLTQKIARTGSLHRIDLQSLPPGMYRFFLLDEEGQKISARGTVIKH